MTGIQILACFTLMCIGASAGVYLGVYLERRRISLMMQNFQAVQNRKGVRRK